MLAIYKRELKSFFTNMTGYFYIAFSLLVTGICVAVINLNPSSAVPQFEYVLSSYVFIIAFLILIPILTMRSFAEERSQKTDQLLYSLPLSMTKIVLGKFLATLTVFAIPFVFMNVFPFVFSLYGEVNFLSAFGSILGFFFLGMALVSIGIFMSSITESQIIAVVLSFGTFLITFVMTSIASLIPQTPIASFLAFTALIVLIGLCAFILTKNIIISASIGVILELIPIGIYVFAKDLLSGSFGVFLSWTSVFDRFFSFIYGSFDLNSIVYYLTLTALFVFFTVQSTEKRRWS